MEAVTIMIGAYMYYNVCTIICHASTHSIHVDMQSWSFIV